MWAAKGSVGRHEFSSGGVELTKIDAYGEGLKGDKEPL
jgi:hypothetical protein